MIEADFRSEYSADLERDVHDRSWRWFCTLALGLLSTESRLAWALRPPPQPQRS